MFKKNKLIFLFIIFFLGLLFFYLINSSNETKPYVKINSQIINIEIADTLEKQIQGLSDRQSLCPDCGMLFVFPTARVQRFWMKNMRFPLDIIWINNNKIVNISKNLPPEGEHPTRAYSSIEPADYVLEINAGAARKWGIRIGDEVKFNLKFY